MRKAQRPREREREGGWQKSPLSLSRERNAHERERERTREAKRRERLLTQTWLLSFFLLCWGFITRPYVLMCLYHTRLDVMTFESEIFHAKIWASAPPFSLSLSDLLTHKIRLSASLQKKKKRNALFVIFSLLFTVFLWIMNTHDDARIQKSFWREWTMIARRRKRTVVRIAPRS